ncbi:MAG: hypothetical protein M3396_11005 [Actinomycetota bacterium]|nr:hypothetical protein [Actinomycetota bacterium]
MALAIGVWAIQGGVALAHSEHPTPENFGGESPSIVNDFGEHYINANNPEVRWDWTCHQFAVPGQGDENANQDNAAMLDRAGDSGLVAPGDKSTACT